MRDGFVLTINAGSSSLKFALFRAGKEPSRELAGKFERIGLDGGKLTLLKVATQKREDLDFNAPNHIACVPMLDEVLKRNGAVDSIHAIGHRVVHGGPHYIETQQVDDKLLEELRRIRSFDPDHLPAELALVKHFTQCYAQVPQIACFDTAFHRDLPRVARVLPIPRRYQAQGVQRYGFHGLSYGYLMQQLRETVGARAARGRLILAHLGNGASMAAVHKGKSIDTTMSFTPTAGLVMSTRSGDLDPGLPAFFARSEGMTAPQFLEMVHTKSGLLGISETSSDVRDLLDLEKKDPRAAEALGIFCYQARKFIGALSAALGGLDILVFSGGIGENSPPIRARICRDLRYLGIELDPKLNKASAPVISRKQGKVSVRVIRTDEELYMARTLCGLLRAGKARPPKKAKH
jgi:acetate kinase